MTLKKIILKKNSSFIRFVSSNSLSYDFRTITNREDIQVKHSVY